MKPGVLLTSLVLLLAAVGSGLSYHEYIQGLQPVPIVESYTATSQSIVTSVQSSVGTTTYAEMVIDETLELTRDHPSWMGCAYRLYYSRSLHDGPLHISYSAHAVKPSNVPTIDFSLMRPVAHPQQAVLVTVCGADFWYGHTPVFTPRSADQYDGTISVPAGNDYEFMFLVHTGNVLAETVYMTIRAEQMVTTVTTLRQTLTSGLDVPYVTSSTSFRAAGFGPLFYASVSLLSAAIGVLVVLVVTSRLGRTREPTSEERGPVEREESVAEESEFRA